MSGNVEHIVRVIVQLLAERNVASSICPSEVARAISQDEATWRALMPEVRQVACEMQDSGRLRITRGGVGVDRSTLGDGPIRLHRP